MRFAFSALVIGPITFLKSFSAPWGSRRSKGFYNIIFYPSRYPFIPLGEEKQLK